MFKQQAQLLNHSDWQSIDIDAQIESKILLRNDGLFPVVQATSSVNTSAEHLFDYLVHRLADTCHEWNDVMYPLNGLDVVFLLMVPTRHLEECESFEGEDLTKEFVMPQGFPEGFRKRFDSIRKVGANNLQKNFNNRDDDNRYLLRKHIQKILILRKGKEVIKNKEPLKDPNSEPEPSGKGWPWNILNRVHQEPDGKALKAGP